MEQLQKLLLALPAALLIAGAAQASTESQIAERIAPVGQVCIEGQECAAQAGASPIASADAGPRSGEAIYGQYCQLCHASGLAGAPKQGDSAAWQTRLDGHGSFDALLQSAINGLNVMPPKGNCSDCSDEELSAAIEFISGLKP